MKPAHRLRSLALAAVVASGVLTACGTSPPPARELADEVIDTLENESGPLSYAVKQCMKDAVDSFELTDDEGFRDLDEAADRAADNDAEAQQVIDRFKAELEACRTAS